MFEHLDDAEAPALDDGFRRRVNARARTLRNRRRIAWSSLSVVAATALTSSGLYFSELRHHDGVQRVEVADSTRDGVPPEPSSAGSVSDPSADASQVDYSDLSGLFGPIDSAFYGDSDPIEVEIQLRDGQERVAASCMAENGHTYPAQLADAEQVRTDLYLNATGTELADSEFRTTSGYGTAKTIAEGLGSDEERDGSYYRKLTREEQDRFDAQLKACDEQAIDQIGLNAPAFRQADEIRAEVADEMRSDNQITDAPSAWSECMATAGYSYTAPQDAEVATFQRTDEALRRNAAKAERDVLAQQELDLAEADWDCQLESIVPARAEARDRYESQALEKNLELLAQLRAVVEAATTAAETS